MSTGKEPQGLTRQRPHGRPDYLRLIILMLVFGHVIACRSSGADGPERQQELAPLTVDDARRLAAQRPRYLQSLPYTPTPTGLADLSAATCGVCHTEIYAEWRISTHARAWKDDPQFLAELEKSAKQNVDWLCMNCHTPLENQLPRLVGALENERLDRPKFVENPTFDARLQEEAITCAVCHVKDGIVLGPYGNAAAPHPTKKAPELLGVEVCTQCHQAQARFEELALACVFDTGREWEESPYAQEGKTCQHCHMPEIDRPLVMPGLMPGDPVVRKTRRHWFGGSLIPKQPQFTEEMAALRPFYPPGLAVISRPLPKVVSSKAKLIWRVDIENREAGHFLPTGDPERFLTIALRARAKDGALLQERTEKIGIEYEWHPTPKKLSDNRLAPRERRNIELEVEAPAKGVLVFEVEAARHRISEQNMRYHQLEGRYVAQQIFHSERHEVRVTKRR